MSTGPQRGWTHVPVQSRSRSKTVQAPSFTPERLSLTGSSGWVGDQYVKNHSSWLTIYRTEYIRSVLYFLTTPRGLGVVSPLGDRRFSCEEVVTASVRVRGCTNGLEDGGYRGVLVK